MVAPSPQMIEAVIAPLLGAGFAASGAVDPREIKAFSAGARVDALLVTENFPRPSPAQLATALRGALPNAAMILVTREVVAAPGDPFHGALKFPVPDKVFVSSVARLIRAARPSSTDFRGVQADIEVMSLRLDDKSHYEILGVAPDASIDDVTAAYDRLSLAYHPDRLRALDEASREKALALYLRIGAAYRVLRSPNDRMRYDAGVEAPPTSEAGPQTYADMSRVPTARKYLDLAQKAEIAGNRAMALAHLRFAATQDPDNQLVQRKLDELAAAP